MDPDRYRSTDIPITAKVTSDLEPAEFCSGVFRRTDGGFMLEFGLGENEYVFERNGEKSRLVSRGLLEYEIDFSASAQTVIKSPYGELKVITEPETDEAVLTDDGVEVTLVYTVVGGERIRRAVKISARFCA